MKADFYETLGIGRDADGKELKSAFRKLAMKFHPDRNPGDKGAELRFKEINEAYECLKNPEKRSAYDRFGHEAFGQGGAGGSAHGFDDIFESIFGTVFNGGGSRRSSGTSLRGADLRYDLEMTLEEAFTWKQANIRFKASSTCAKCSGSGARRGSTPSSCAECAGQGKVRSSQGFFTIERTCPQCQGRGATVADPCPDCGGTGQVDKHRSIYVDIPAGVEDGTRIRVTGEGAAGVNGGPAGDLYVFVAVKPHKRFTREGADLHCEATVSMPTAALGGSLDVEGLDGAKVQVKVPEGMQSGHVFRLRGRGMPVPRQSGSGDLYVKANVGTPRKLSKRQKDLLKEFEALSS